jgi:uncharacterized protein YeaO (DUF488 family)
MDLAFYQLLGEVGATLVTVAFSLFVAYLLYLREQRDKIGNQILASKSSIYSVLTRLLETPIPGVSGSLISKEPSKDEKLAMLSITEWAAGVSWEMRVRVGEIKENEVWEKVTKALENLVQGILPEGSLPVLEKDSEQFRKWATRFVDSTEHIRWFTHDYADHSWAKSLIEYMQEWEEKHPNPVLRSQDVALLLDRIMILRQLVTQDLLFESDYQSLKIENAIGNYKAIIIGFVVMGFSSILMPLMVLLFPPFNENYATYLGDYLISIDVQWLSVVVLAIFVSSSIAVLSVILRTAKK